MYFLQIHHKKGKNEENKIVVLVNIIDSFSTYN